MYPIHSLCVLDLFFKLANSHHPTATGIPSEMNNEQQSANTFSRL